MGEDVSDTKELQSSSSSSSNSGSSGKGRDTNLNMASALTHVGGDSLRTGAVFVAAIVAR
jgi:Co/Zn/Cd efflux system component